MSEGLYKRAWDWSRLQETLWPFGPKLPEVAGRYGRGNIDLDSRKVYTNRDGSISTERSFSINDGGKEVLLPTIIGGRPVSQDDAVRYYRLTGQHLGKFDKVDEANKYAEALHRRQADRYAVKIREKK